MFAAQQGCKRPTSWTAKWPLGLDLLLRVFQAAKKDRILSFFYEIVQESGSTFVQHLLGVSGIDTIDPENIESILSTNFKGNPRVCLLISKWVNFYPRLRPRSSSKDIPRPVR